MNCGSIPLFLLFLSQGAGWGQLEFGVRTKLTDPVFNTLFSKVADMDGDGDPDVFTATAHGLEARWWENDGSAQFTLHHWEPEKPIFQQVFGLADWDGDGRQDLYLEETTDAIGGGNPGGAAGIVDLELLGGLFLS